MTYEEWMAALDAKVQAKCGLSMYDLPDILFRDHFKDGLTPDEVIETETYDHWSDLQMLT